MHVEWSWDGERTERRSGLLVSRNGSDKDAGQPLKSIKLPPTAVFSAVRTETNLGRLMDEKRNSEEIDIEPNCLKDSFYFDDDNHTVIVIYETIKLI